MGSIPAILILEKMLFNSISTRRGLAFALEISLFIGLMPQMPNPLRFTTATIPQHQEGRAFAEEIPRLIR